MSSTQEHLVIQDIKQNLVLLKNGSVAMVLKTTAVNFDLLSEREQLAIIDAFAATLNSLSYPIQIVIRSKRLNISSYLDLLSKAEQNQQNPLLKNMMRHYKQFVSALIRENEVLDKSFYIVIPVSYLELGIISDSQKNLQKATTILIPRRDHLTKFIARMGMKAVQLNTERLIRLFYDYYNEDLDIEVEFKEAPAKTIPTPTAPVPPEPKPAAPTPAAPPVFVTQLRPTIAKPTPQPTPVAPSVPNQPTPTFIPNLKEAPPTYTMKPKPAPRVPFVVEELPDDYGRM